MEYRILLVDDHPHLLQAVGRTLRDAGYSVTCTNNGLDALAILQGRPAPDLVILDMLMPVMDGEKVLERLGPAAPPILVITGSSVDRALPKPELVARVLSKPFEPSELLVAVADAIDMKKVREVGT